jgi:hypothetical protein
MIFLLIPLPLLLLLPARWVRRRLLRPGASTAPQYWLTAAACAVFLPALLYIPVTARAASAYAGTCSGWMDSGPRACGFAEFVQQQLFRLSLAWVVPLGVFWLGLALLFAAGWKRRAIARGPASWRRV